MKGNDFLLVVSLYVFILSKVCVNQSLLLTYTVNRSLEQLSLW